MTRSRHAEKCDLPTKSIKIGTLKPLRFKGSSGAAGRIRTADLILTKRPRNFFLTIFRTLQPYPLQSARFPSLLKTKVSAHSAALCGWLCGQGGDSRLHDLTVCTKVVKASHFTHNNTCFASNFQLQVSCKLDASCIVGFVPHCE